MTATHNLKFLIQLMFGIAYVDLLLFWAKQLYAMENTPFWAMIGRSAETLTLPTHFIWQHGFFWLAPGVAAWFPQSDLTPVGQYLAHQLMNAPLLGEVFFNLFNWNGSFDWLPLITVGALLALQGMVIEALYSHS